MPDRQTGGNLPGRSQMKRDNPTFDEKLLSIQSEANPRRDQGSRALLLDNIGVKPAKPTAENLIILSCFAVGGLAMQVRSLLWLLDRMGVDYTYLHPPEKEYCCGWTVKQDSKYEFSKYFIGLNIDQARKLGAKRMFCFCIECLFQYKVARCNDPDDANDIPQLYHLDLVVEALKKKHFPLKMEPPTRIAYFEGCHKRHEALLPNWKLDWSGYRQMLDQIEGLEIVDLPVKGCCTSPTVSARLVNQAIEAGASQLITPCTTCVIRIKAGLKEVDPKRKFPIRLPTELLLEASGIKDEWLYRARYE
jgi:Fe-S oxidoreductase